MKNPIERQRGFTLLEMMAALLIGAVIVTPMYIVTRTMAQQTDNGRMEIEAMQRARVGMDTLARDLGLTGLAVSPNTELEVSNPSVNYKITGSSAQYRNAVVHLNRGLPGNDAIMLTGGFLGGEVYKAVLNGANQIQFLRTDFTEHSCQTQFSPEYAHAHIVNASGESLDAKVEDLTWAPDTRTCSISARIADLDPAYISQGEVMYVSANQTALYWVETQGDHPALVRYFISYESASSAGTGCALDGAQDVGAIAFPGSSAPVLATRQVIAEYVVDFQIWFRPATRSGTTDWITPHYHPASTISAENSGNFNMGFLMSDEAYVFPRAASDGNMTNLNDLSCAANASKNIGSEHIRSAMIRLSVRTELTDQSIETAAFDMDNSRIAAYTLKGYDPASASVVTDKPGAAYKLKTLATEVAMPNLASKAGLVDLEQ